MDAVSFGPLMLSTERLWLIVAVAVFFFGAELMHRKWPDTGLSSWSQQTFWYSLISGRLAYVVLNPESYQHDWLTVLYFWQPGYSLAAAMITALTVTLWHLNRQRKLLVYPLLWLMVCVAGWQGLTIWQPLSSSVVRTLPAIQLPGLNATATDLSALKEPVIVNLWASWCGPCRREMPALVAFAKDTPEVRILLVNAGESAITVEAFLRENDTEIPENLILLDPTQQLMRHFEAPGLPVTLAFNNGQLTDSHIGELSHGRLTDMARLITGR